MHDTDLALFAELPCDVLRKIYLVYRSVPIATVLAMCNRRERGPSAELRAAMKDMDVEARGKVYWDWPRPPSDEVSSVPRFCRHGTRGVACTCFAFLVFRDGTYYYQRFKVVLSPWGHVWGTLKWGAPAWKKQRWARLDGPPAHGCDVLIARVAEGRFEPVVVAQGHDVSAAAWRAATALRGELIGALIAL